MIIGQFDVFPDGGNDDSGFLSACFFQEQATHDPGIAIVQMTDRFVQKDKVERLAERPDKGDPLLLPERELPDLCMSFVCNPHCIEKGENLLFLPVTGQVVFQLDVLECRQFGKQA